MAGNWQMVMNSRWAVLPSMASMSGLSLSHRPTCSGRPTVGCPAGSDTRSREGRRFTASLHCPSGGAEQRGRGAGQGVAGQFPGPGVHGDHHLGRGLHLLVRVLVEGDGGRTCLQFIACWAFRIKGVTIEGFNAFTERQSFDLDGRHVFFSARMVWARPALWRQFGGVSSV